jgi:hypothetical protein
MPWLTKGITMSITPKYRVDHNGYLTAVGGSPIPRTILCIPPYPNLRKSIEDLLNAEHESKPDVPEDIAELLQDNKVLREAKEKLEKQLNKIKEIIND